MDTPQGRMTGLQLIIGGRRFAETPDYLRRKAEDFERQADRAVDQLTYLRLQALAARYRERAVELEDEEAR
jgi:hypothetical protein